jgi:hypothetical protein
MNTDVPKRVTFDSSGHDARHGALNEAIDRSGWQWQRFGVQAVSAFDWLARSYDNIQGATLIERIHSNAAYRGIPAPRTLDSRYVLEDVPTGLVPIVALGQLAGVEMPASVGLVNICCALYQRDFTRGSAAHGGGLGMTKPKPLSGEESTGALLEEGGISMLDETP